jgi:hypothetical protein
VGGVVGVIAALVVGLVGTILFAARAEHNAGVAKEEGRLARYQAYLARLAAAGAALQTHDVGEAARQLNKAPEELRGWEWRHLHSRLDDSASMLQLIDEGSIVLLAGPDGLRVGTVADEVRITDPEGRQSLTYSLVPELYARLVQVLGQTWVAGDAGLRAMHLRDATGRVRCLIDDPACGTSRQIVVSPDGARVAITWRDTPWGGMPPAFTRRGRGGGSRLAAATRGAPGISA